MRAPWAEYMMVSATVAVEVAYNLRPDGSRASSGHLWRVHDYATNSRGSRHNSRRSAVAIALHLARARGEETTEP